MVHVTTDETCVARTRDSVEGVCVCPVELEVAISFIPGIRPPTLIVDIVIVITGRDVVVQRTSVRITCIVTFLCECSYAKPTVCRGVAAASIFPCQRRRKETVRGQLIGMLYIHYVECAYFDLSWPKCNNTFAPAECVHSTRSVLFRHRKNAVDPHLLVCIRCVCARLLARTLAVGCFPSRYVEILILRTARARLARQCGAPGGGGR